MASNYEVTKIKMRQEFLKYDQEEMIHRFPVTADDDFLCFSLMGGEARVDRKTGEVFCRFSDQDFYEADYNEALTVYDLLCYTKKGAYPSKEYAPLQSLTTVHSQTVGFKSSEFHTSEAAEYDQDEAALKKVLAALQGEPAGTGDVSAFLPVFGGLRALFRFYHADDEFPADVQLLWDTNSLQFMHYETLWLASNAVLKRIRTLFHAYSTTS